MFNISRSVCFSAFLSASCAFGTEGTNITTDLPDGTYLRDLGMTHPEILIETSNEKSIKINDDGNGGRTLTLTLQEQVSSITQVDKYLDLGFDIVLAADKLALVPAKIKHIVSYRLNLGEPAEHYEQKFPWVFDRDIGLPDTCDLPTTKYIKENQLLITYCQKFESTILRKNIITNFQPGQLDNLANIDGFLSYTNPDYQKEACEKKGGRIQRINNGLETAICNGDLPENVRLPEGVKVAGYDILHDVLYAKKEVFAPEYYHRRNHYCSSLIGNHHLYKNNGSALLHKCFKHFEEEVYAVNSSCRRKNQKQYELVSPKKCIDQDLKIEVIGDQLVCVQQQ